MELPSLILTWTMWMFLASLLLLASFRVLAEGRTQSLLRVKDPQNPTVAQPFSPARLQLLVVTLAAAGYLLLNTASGARDLHLPQEFDYVLLGSNVSYLLFKGRQLQHLAR
jgi:hypothetical protein